VPYVPAGEAGGEGGARQRPLSYKTHADTYRYAYLQERPRALREICILQPLTAGALHRSLVRFEVARQRKAV
jgi:hypothetical protein